MKRRTWSFLAAGSMFMGSFAAFPQTAEARGRIAFHLGILVRGPLGWPGYGYPCSFDSYWGPCYGPYVPVVSQGPEMGPAAAVGAVDLDVKPAAAEVWIDGRFLAEASARDGSPGVLWLTAGPHHLLVHREEYRGFEEDISVQPGQRMDLKIRLERGDSPVCVPDRAPTPSH